MRGLAAVALLGMLAGCTSVRVAQRDGCWVRQTETWAGQVTEELGPCARGVRSWSDDRLTRLVQECVAQADHRWQSRALLAWNRGEPLPDPESDQAVLQACMNESGRALVGENETLQDRLAEVSEEREVLRELLEEDRAHLRQSNDRMAGYLGEAAQKPAGSATATATSNSDGKAVTENGSSLQAAPAMSVEAGPSPLNAPKPTRTRQVAAPQSKASSPAIPSKRSPPRSAKASGPDCEPGPTQGAEDKPELTLGDTLAKNAKAGSPRVKEDGEDEDEDESPPAGLPPGAPEPD